jgi:2-polyprenyl-6-methoxyphenol hydroxylase-like FAD-dependent oxidoreductase
MNADANVLVVGAGPTGLLAALGLARMGIAVTVVDQELSPSKAPRATNYMPPVVKVLDSFGVLDEVLRVALKNDTFWQYYKLEDQRVPVCFDVVKDLTPYHYGVQCGQHTLASVILEHLAKLPHVKVLWGRQVLGIQQDATGVATTLQSAQGTETLRSDWVVGADGARSAVRRSIGATFEGHTWPERFVATNVWLDLEEHGFGKTTLVHHPVDWAVTVKINKEGLWRVTYGEDASLPEDEVLRRIPERYGRILPASALRATYDIESAAPYRVHQRCADRLRVGRVLLAGDAAHITNPVGGMGLNTGALDAAHVVTALGAVIQGRCDDKVLDFYDADRRRVYWEVTNSTSTEHKRRLREPSPVRRAQDFGLLVAARENPHIARAIVMSFFDAEGHPMPV